MALLTVAASPVLAAAATAISLLSRRSPFVAHRRVGQGGAPFWMWKLRTMWPESDPPAGHWQLVERLNTPDVPERKALSLDPRIGNAFSAFCRRHSIDELPQLIHVLCGQMSLVGPRPITKQELDRHYGAGAAEILQMRPGLTGLWQVSGRGWLTYEERYRLDLELVRKFSAGMYIVILLKTIPKLITGAGSR